VSRLARVEGSFSVTIQIRLLLSVGLGLVFGWKAARFASQHEMPRDFDQVWFAAGAVLAGQNPYHLIGPGRPFAWEFPFFYPLPAALIATPLAALPVVWADGVFVAAGSACFVWAITRRGYATLPCLFAVPFLAAVQTAQWSPLLSASLVVAPLGFFTVAKPTIGAALFLARPTRWPIIGAVILTVLAFALQPGWFTDWMSGFAEAAARRPLHFSAPIVQQGGFVALAGLLRWRRREGRLITALACVPQTLVMYESLPLLLVPQTLGESIAMVVLTYIVDLLNIATVHGNQLYGAGRWLWILYGGAALIVLRRPNSESLDAEPPAACLAGQEREAHRPN
jgi:hypothetical protein